MKWQQIRDNYAKIKIGCLFAYVRGYDVAYFEWFVAPDDEDKSYRRALAGGRSDSMDAAKTAVVAAILGIAEDLLKELAVSEGQNEHE